MMSDLIGVMCVCYFRWYFEIVVLNDERGSGSIMVGFDLCDADDEHHPTARYIQNHTSTHPHIHTSTHPHIHTSRVTLYMTHDT